MHRFLLLAALPLLVANVARAEWTARTVSKVEGAKDAPAMNGRMFVRGGKVRVEMDAPVRQVTITDPAAKRTWILDASSKTYTELDHTKQPGASQEGPTCHGANVDACLAAEGFKKKGTGEANGRRCDVWERTTTEGGRATTVRLWRPLDVPFGFVRMVVTTPEGGLTTDVLDLEQKKLDDALFRIPAGYTKRELPSYGMPQGRPGAGPAMGGAGMDAPMSQEQLEQLMKQYGIQPPKSAE